MPEQTGPNGIKEGQTHTNGVAQYSKHPLQIGRISNCNVRAIRPRRAIS
jgi:hypothetical protein